MSARDALYRTVRPCEGLQLIDADQSLKVPLPGLLQIGVLNRADRFGRSQWGPPAQPSESLQRIDDPARALWVDRRETLLVTTPRLVALLGWNVTIESDEERRIHVVVRPVVRTQRDHDGVVSAGHAMIIRSVA